MTEADPAQMTFSDLSDSDDEGRHRYSAWRDSAAGAAVLPLFERFALQLAARGRRFGFRMIAEQVRWEILTTWDVDSDGFKVNDHYTPYIARELAAKHPQIAALVEFRGRPGSSPTPPFA